MKIAVIGATGKAGYLIAREAQQRGHQVTAIIRHPNRLKLKIPFIQKDLFDLTTNDVSTFDVLIDAFNAPRQQEILHQKSVRHLVEIVSTTQVRLVVVGGAGSLYIDEDRHTQLYQTPTFPPVAFPTSSNMAASLEFLKESSDISWLYVSPSANFIPDGPLLNHYQVGTDQLQVDKAGKSEISYADYAVALMDEIESPKYQNQQINVVW
ncbi:NAD(P)-dependent oxidoreductase [Pediococcus claussenii]|uniref:Dihydrodipicolinate reductase, family protein n=1 Tax=Pediococcus claussenii (strain ATCC BAA-344 / DSM 14800 / JCM 18046 / KCTC 3811 / LMG 21948 / P06) TaxID=701521 RepID=G8PB83_PEDCP|nr:NAD(P)H-binding protein [Pediococcus claussenii]AEV94712.1 dihydrodipicolinate reductase, family protein [Pediococcus claussenii ATCC BAA-344]ANZ69907.1 NADH-flavin reductase [Pediococcus claussenii]ANZ71724.1 NADH-flavin reductase [Pediococcus claussenii]